MNRVKGKSALITGASSGIGEATAEKLAEHGVNLYLVARRIDRLEKLSNELKSKYKIDVKISQLDVRNRSAVEEFGLQLKKENFVPDFLINNAGLARGADKIHEADIDDWEEMIDTNVKGLLYITRTILPEMVKRNSGHVINMGSTAGEVVYPGGNVYNLTKFGIKALSQAMHLDLVNTNIKVTNIAPGSVETEFSLVRYKGDEKKAAEKYKGYEPLAASDIAESIFYVLNSPENVSIHHMVITCTAQRSGSVTGVKK